MEEKNLRPGLWKRTFLIIPSFQRSFLLQVALIVIAIFMGFTLIEQFTLAEIQQLEVSEKASYEEMYLTLKSRVEIVSVAQFFFTMFVLLLWGVIFSHKVAGPIYRIQQILEDMIHKRKPETFKLRKNDYFHELAETVEKLSEKN